MQLHNFEISTSETELMALCGSTSIGYKLVLDGMSLNQVQLFKFLSCTAFPFLELGIKCKTEALSRTYGTIMKIMRNTSKRQTMKKFYKTIVVPAVFYGNFSLLLFKL